MKITISTDRFNIFVIFSVQYKIRPRCIMMASHIKWHKIDDNLSLKIMS